MLAVLGKALLDVREKMLAYVLVYMRDNSAVVGLLGILIEFVV